MNKPYPLAHTTPIHGNPRPVISLPFTSSHMSSLSPPPFPPSDPSHPSHPSHLPLITRHYTGQLSLCMALHLLHFSSSNLYPTSKPLTKHSSRGVPKPPRSNHTHAPVHNIQFLTPNSTFHPSRSTSQELSIPSTCIPSESPSFTPLHAPSRNSKPLLNFLHFHCATLHPLPLGLRKDCWRITRENAKLV